MGGRGSASMKSKSSSGENMSTGGHLDPMDSKQANSYLESLGISNTKGTIKAIESYTGEGYQKMRSGKDPNSIALIDNYISKSPKFEGTIYRGMSVDSSYISELKNNIGGKISMGVSSSWTSDKGTARSYTRGVGERVIFKMNNKRGASVTNLSRYGKAEQEVMHKSNEQYTIVSVRKQGKNTVVTLADE